MGSPWAWEEGTHSQWCEGCALAVRCGKKRGCRWATERGVGCATGAGMRYRSATLCQQRTPWDGGKRLVALGRGREQMCRYQRA